MKGLDFIRYGAIAASVLAVAAGVILLYPGSAGLIPGMSDKGALEAIDFETLTLPDNDDAWLVCPENFCAMAEPYEISKIYSMSTHQLRTIVLDYADSQPDLETRSLDMTRQQFEFTERVPNLLIPDIIAVRIFDLGENRSTLAIYSRSFDSNVAPDHNQGKIKRWLQIIDPGS